MTVRFLIWFSLISTIITVPASGQEHLFIEVESRVDTSVITIGDRVTYSLIIKRDKDLSIARPGAGVNLGMFEIKSYHFSDPVERDGQITERFDFTISVFDTGRFTIPPFPVAYFEDDTSAYQIIEASPIDIYVKSVISGEEAPELKDIKAPIYFPFDYVFWISMAAIAVLLGVIGILGYRLWKKRKERGYLFKPPTPPRPAHEVALEALDALYRSDLIERKEYKLFFSRLSEIIRIYLEGRYFISAMEETTAEILWDIQRHTEKPEHREWLSGLLQLSDMVKFAKYIPEPDEIEQSKSQARHYIEETKILFVQDEVNTLQNETGASTDEPVEETKEIVQIK